MPTYLDPEAVASAVKRIEERGVPVDAAAYYDAYTQLLTADRDEGQQIENEHFRHLPLHTIWDGGRLRSKLERKWQGRIYATGLSVQNMDRDLRVGISGSGTHMVYADISSCHPRILAELSGDPILLGELSAGDAYVMPTTWIAEELGLDVVAARTMAKRVIMAMLNGAGKKRIRELLGGTEEQGQRLTNEVKAHWATAFAHLKAVAEATEKNGWKLSHPDGTPLMPCGEPLVMPKDKRQSHRVKANYLQAIEAERMTQVLLRCADEPIVMMMHDALLLEVTPVQLAATTGKLKSIMEEHFGVGSVSIEVGPAWGVTGTGVGQSEVLDIEVLAFRGQGLLAQLAQQDPPYTLTDVQQHYLWAYSWSKWRDEKTMDAHLGMMVGARSAKKVALRAKLILPPTARRVLDGRKYIGFDRLRGIGIMAEYLAALEFHPAYSSIRMNRRGGVVEISQEARQEIGLPPGRPILSEEERRLVGLDITKKYGLKYDDEAIFAAIGIAASLRAYDPVRDMFDKLPTWDGVERLPMLLQDHAGAEDTDYTRAVSTKWFIQMMARTYEPGCEAQTALILHGASDQGKTTFFKTLFSPYLAIHDVDPGSTNTAMICQQALVVLWDEMASFSKRDVNKLKGWMTETVDEYRQPYARSPVKWPRSYVVAGTTNYPEIIHDHVGARRFWIVTLHKEIDIPILAGVRDQILAEAKHRYLAGEKWWFTAAEDKLLRLPQTEKYEVPDVVTETITAWVRANPDVWVRTRDVLLWSKIVEKESDLARVGYAVEAKVRAVLNRLGSAKRRTKDGFCWQTPSRD